MADILTSHRPGTFPGLPRLELPAPEPLVQSYRDAPAAEVPSAAHENRRAVP